MCFGVTGLYPDLLDYNRSNVECDEPGDSGVSAEVCVAGEYVIALLVWRDDSLDDG